MLHSIGSDWSSDVCSSDLTPGAVSDPLGTTFVTKIDLTAATPSRIDCIANTASMAGGYVAPFELVTIQGTGIGPKDTASTIVKDGLIDTTILNTRVLFDGTPAPLVYVSPNRINAIVPGSVSFRTSTKVQVEQAGQLSSVFTIPVVNTSLTFFTASGQGVGQAAAINQDGTVNSPANPAARGSVVSLFINGYGVINSEVSRPVGQVATDSRTVNAPSVQIGSFNGVVTFAGYVPGFTTSLLQLNVRVPAAGNIGPNVPIFIFQATPLSSQRVFLAVK